MNVDDSGLCLTTCFFWLHFTYWVVCSQVEMLKQQSGIPCFLLQKYKCFLKFFVQLMLSYGWSPGWASTSLTCHWMKTDTQDMGFLLKSACIKMQVFFAFVLFQLNHLSTCAKISDTYLMRYWVLYIVKQFFSFTLRFSIENMTQLNHFKKQNLVLLKRITVLDLQWCVNFMYTAKWLSYTYIHIHSFFRFFTHIDSYRILSEAPCVI